MKRQLADGRMNGFCTIRIVKQNNATDIGHIRGVLRCRWENYLVITWYLYLVDYRGSFH
jgi:hypothetical protein